MSDQETVTQEVSTGAPEGPRFSLSDLAALREIVRVASERGAFRAEELTPVGGVYDRLSAFLAAGEAAANSGSDTSSNTSDEAAPEGDSVNA